MIGMSSHKRALPGVLVGSPNLSAQELLVAGEMAPSSKIKH